MKKFMTLLCVLTCIFAWAQSVIGVGQGNSPKAPQQARKSVTVKADTYPTIWVLGEMGVMQDTTEVQIGYRPDLGNKMTTTDGNIYTATVHFFNTAGDASHNFGFCKTETLASGPAGWDEIASSRFGAATPNTKIVLGEPAAVGELQASKENFFQIATGTYIVTLNLTAKTVVCTPVGETTKVYIMGNGVKDQANAANVGTEMETSDAKVFSKEVTFVAPSGSTKAPFSFSTALGTTADGWDAIAANRFGATAANTEVTLSTELALGAFNDSKDNNFIIDPGTYKVTVNMDTKVIKVTPKEYPPLYIMGRLTGQVWAASQGTPMKTTDGNIYTIDASFTAAEDKTEATFGFTTVIGNNPGDWDVINNYRIGFTDSYGSDGYPVLYGKEMKLGAAGNASKENFFAVQNGNYTVTVNLAKRTCVVEPDSAYSKLYVMGRVMSTDTLGNKKYQAWAADQGTQLYTHDFKNYSGRLTFQDDLGSANVGFSFTTKLGADFTKWDDIASSRFGAQANNTPVTLGTPMQCGNFLDSKENQFTIPVGNYDVNMDLSTRTLTVSTVPFTNVYILGEIAYTKDGSWFHQVWSPARYSQMSTTDGENYTDTINVENDTNTAFATIGFTTKISGGDADWDNIANYRFGAMTAGGEDMPFNTEVTCGNYLESKENKFTVRRGTYYISLKLSDRTVKLVPATTPVIYLIGTTEGKNFAANEGLAIPASDNYGKTYSAAKVTFNSDAPQFVLSDKLASAADAWSEIESYTFGPDQDQTAIVDKAATPFGSHANAWTVTAKAYSVTIDMVNSTITLDSDLSGISENVANANLKVYPNPTSGIVNVAAGKVINKVEVFNTLNQLVNVVNGVGASSVTLDLSSQAAGIYFVRINGNTIAKLIKK